MRTQLIASLLALAFLLALPLVSAAFSGSDPAGDASPGAIDIINGEIQVSENYFDVTFTLAEPIGTPPTTHTYTYKVVINDEDVYSVSVQDSGQVTCRVGVCGQSGPYRNVVVSGNTVSFRVLTNFLNVNAPTPSDSVVMQARESRYGNLLNGDELRLQFSSEGCTTNADCNDGVFCNGQEQCVNGQCQAGQPVTCNDGVSCTQDSCDENLDRCVNTPDNNLCSAGQTCDAQQGCVETGSSGGGNGQGGNQGGSCTSNADCDDNIACTFDTCVEGQCYNLPNDNFCGEGEYCNAQSGRCEAEDVSCQLELDSTNVAFNNDFWNRYTRTGNIEVFLVPRSSTSPVKNRAYGLDIVMRANYDEDKGTPFVSASFPIVYNPTEIEIINTNPTGFGEIWSVDTSRSSFSHDWLLAGYYPIFRTDGSRESDPTDGDTIFGVASGFTWVPVICPMRRSYVLGTIWVKPVSDRFTIELPSIIPGTLRDTSVAHIASFAPGHPEIPHSRFALSMEVCDPATENCPAECSTNADCDDGLACNGQEQCQQGVCVSGTPPNCAEQPNDIECTIDRCEE
ncbi:hypothetical protein D6817_05670, partial [Candidatus Pacearchaeota archaeon]